MFDGLGRTDGGMIPAGDECQRCFRCLKRKSRCEVFGHETPQKRDGRKKHQI